MMLVGIVLRIVAIDFIARILRRLETARRQPVSVELPVRIAKVFDNTLEMQYCMFAAGDVHQPDLFAGFRSRRNCDACIITAFVLWGNIGIIKRDTDKQRILVQ